MTRLQTIIAVKDVVKSSEWYRELFGFRSNHGGTTFEMLANSDNSIVLCLHALEQHGHPTMKDDGNEKGNGLILYFRVDDLETTWQNALQLQAVIESEPRLNPNSGEREFALRDPDNYFLLVSL